MKNINILVVEDNPIILGMMQCMFKSIDHQVDIATTAAEAMTLFSQNKYQLIISDIGLPDKNGVELVDSIRCLEKQKNSEPAYVCGATAFDIQQYRQSCFDAGFDDVVSKPMNLHFLQHLIVKTKCHFA